MSINLPINVENMLKLPAHIYWKDSNLCYLGCNDFMAENLNLNSRNDIAGISDFDTIISKQSASTYQQQDRFILTTNKSSNFIDDGCYKNGCLTFFYTLKFPLVNKTSKIQGIFGISLPINDKNHQNLLLQVKDLGFNHIIDDFNEILNNKKLQNSPFCCLTKRENECLRLIIFGYSAGAIGKKLEISKRTVEDYINNIKNKLGLFTKVELIEFALTFHFLDFYNHKY